MKEAAGEANMTVITIVLIGVVAAVGAIVIPKMLDGMQKRSFCSELGGTLSGDTCIRKKYDNNASGELSSCGLVKCEKEGEYKGQWTCQSWCK